MIQRSACAFLLLFALPPVPGALARGHRPPTQQAWAYVVSGPVAVHSTPSDRKPAKIQLHRGAVLKMFGAQNRAGAAWTQVEAVDPAALTPQMSWVESRGIEILPLDRLPEDAELLKQLGGMYLDDFNATHTAVARYQVRQGAGAPLLVCLLGGPIFPEARLQVFQIASGKLSSGASLVVPFSGMQATITEIEVQDLVGDGNECLISRESFGGGAVNGGVNMVIRRVEGGSLKTLWKAPLEFHNLASFPPHPGPLQPPERNIGAPATVTTATVEFRQRGKLREPLWKGKIEIRAFGRETPIEILSFEKACAWDGTKFAPVD